jgi:hypothetical protein
LHTGSSIDEINNPACLPDGDCGRRAQMATISRPIAMLVTSTSCVIRR